MNQGKIGSLSEKCWDIGATSIPGVLGTATWPIIGRSVARIRRPSGKWSLIDAGYTNMKQRSRMLGRLTVVACTTLLMYESPLTSKAIAADFSNWQYHYDISSRGTPICSILSAARNANIGKNIVIKGFKSEENLHVDIYKDTWNIPRGTDVNVTFDFDDNEPLTLPAYGDGHILDVELPTQHTAIFLSLVVERPFIQVIFPGGNEGTWVVVANGARAATMKLVECLRGLGPSKRQGTSSRAPTQPFGAPPSTQPFGSDTSR